MGEKRTTVGPQLDRAGRRQVEGVAPLTDWRSYEILEKWADQLTAEPTGTPLMGLPTNHTSATVSNTTYFDSMILKETVMSSTT